MIDSGGALMTWLPRTLGVLTAGYGLATLIKPAILARPSGLSAGEPSAEVSTLVRAVGVRDIASGLAMVVATGQAQRIAVGVRIAADLGDVVTWAFSSSPDRDQRRKTMAVGAGWAALNAIGLATLR
jgi:hypothetical protein